ncbi:MAG: HAD family hydrolase [Flavobacteriales bacterium]
MIDLPSSFKAFIFDLDGTLADTMSVHYKACQLVCNRNGFDFPEDYFYQEAGKPTLEVFRNLILKLGIKGIDGNELGQEKEKKFLELIPSVKPVKFVSQIAKKYKGKIPMAIGSGGQRNTVELTLTAIGFDDFFDSIVTCDDVEYHKPHPETFLKAALEMGVEPHECVVFEDGDPGLEAAKTAGMMTIDVRYYI